MNELERLEAELAQAYADAEAALLVLNAAKDREDRALRGGSSGRRLPQSTWSNLIGDVKAAGRTHQEALARVARLKGRIKPLKMAASNAEHAEWVAKQVNRELGFAEHFMNIARELLDPEVFTTLMREATLAKNRDLVRYAGNTGVGAALGVRGSAGGMRQRKES